MLSKKNKHRVLRLQAGHKYCLLGKLSSEVGWNHYDTIKVSLSFCFDFVDFFCVVRCSANNTYICGIDLLIYIYKFLNAFYLHLKHNNYYAVLCVMFHNI